MNSINDNVFISHATKDNVFDFLFSALPCPVFDRI